MRRWPSSSRCSKAAAAPPSESKRTDERRGARLSMSTTCSSAARPSGGMDLEQQITVDRAGAQRLERLLLPAAVVAGVDQRHRVAGLGGPRAERRAGRARRTGWSRRAPAARPPVSSPGAAPARRRWAGSRARVPRGGPSPAWPPTPARGPCPRRRARPWTATRRLGERRRRWSRGCGRRRRWPTCNHAGGPPWGGKQHPRAASSLCDEVDGTIGHT